jgi:hypothetical protein
MTMVSSRQLTPPLVGSLFTIAVNGCLAPDCTTAGLGMTEIVIPRIVTLTEADAAGKATEVAVMVTKVFLAGGLA